MKDPIERQAAIDAMFEGMPGLTFSDVLKILRELPSAQPEQPWIPCSKRLPENGYWLWSAKGGEVQKDFYWDGHWENAEKYGYEVMAWMPLPEPYKGEKHG